MFLRLAIVAPLALTAILPAQLAPTSPATPAKPVAQDPVKEQSPAEKLEMLKKEKARLQREIKFATERVQQAKSLMAAKLQRKQPVFKSIDAGKPASAVPIKPNQVQRKYARIGTKDEMNYGGNEMMIMVNDRAISQASYDAVMNYLQESGTGGTDALRAQRVLFDLIRIEAVASQFIENEGEIKLSENLALLEDGSKTFAAAAAEFGSVASAKEDGSVDISRNSILGPYFEYVAFSTPVGKMSRPFRTTNGYAVIKVDSVEKGAQKTLDKVKAHVVQFAYSSDQKTMQQAQFKVNSGQVQVLVRDQAVMDLLPALFKPAPPKMNPMQRLQQQISMAQSQLQELGGKNPEKAKALQAQIERMRANLKQMQSKGSSDATPKTDASNVPDSARGDAGKKGPMKKAPVKKQ